MKQKMFFTSAVSFLLVKPLPRMFYKNEPVTEILAADLVRFLRVNLIAQQKQSASFPRLSLAVPMSPQGMFHR